MASAGDLALTLKTVTTTTGSGTSAVTTTTGSNLTLNELEVAASTTLTVESASRLNFGKAGSAAPGTLQTWSGAIVNNGTIDFNVGNVALMNVTNNGTLTVEDTVLTAVPAWLGGDGTTVGSFQNLGTVNLNGAGRIMQLTDSGWTNNGVLNVNGVPNFGFAPATALKLINLNGSTVKISGVNYTFDDTVQLDNGGIVTAGVGSTITFNALSETVPGLPEYRTEAGGRMDFTFAADSTVHANGLKGNLVNSGTMKFSSEGQKYYGTLTNNATGGIEIDEASYFVESVTNSGNILVTKQATFADTVTTTNDFTVATGAEAVFGGTLNVRHDFTLETGASGQFQAVNISSANTKEPVFNIANTRDTVFTVAAGANAVFNGAVANTNFGTSWVSALVIDGKAEFKGALTNTASAGKAYLAQITVNSDDTSSFSAITNSGAGAVFEMNGSGNEFKGTLVNSGRFYLNGSNAYNNIVNSGLFYVNDGADGSKFAAVTNNAAGTFVVVNFDETAPRVIDLTFNGNVTNAGSFQLKAEGSTFYGAVTNSGDFQLYAAGTFEGKFTNSAQVIVSADGSTFRLVDNAQNGTFYANAAATFADTVTNRGTFEVNYAQNFEQFDNAGTLNLNVSGTRFNPLNNSGTLRITAAGDSTTPSVVFDTNELYNLSTGTILIGPDNNGAGVYAEFGANAGSVFENEGTIKIYNASNGFVVPVANYGTLEFLLDTGVVAGQVIENGPAS